MFSGISWAFLTAMAGAVLTIVVTPAVLHSLGTTGFGLYSLVFSVVSYTGFLDVGITWAAGRFMAADYAAQDFDRLRSRYNVSALFLLAIGATGTLVACAIANRIAAMIDAPAEPLRLGLAIASISFAMGLQTGLLCAMLRAIQRHRIAAQMSFTLLVLTQAGAYVGALTHAGLNGFLLLNALAQAVTLTVAFWSSRMLVPAGAAVRLADWTLLSSMWVFGGWSTVSKLAITLMQQLDKLVVATVGSVGTLPFYAVPSGVASRVNTVGMVSASQFFARASYLAATSRDELATAYGMARRMLAVAALALTIPLCFVGDRFLSAWLGGEMSRRAYPILVVLAVGQGFMSVGSIAAVTLEALGLPRAVALTSISLTPVAAAVAWWWLPTDAGLAVAMGVATWMIGAAVLNLVLCGRAMAHGNSRVDFPLMKLLLATVASAMFATLVRPMADGMVSCLAVMAMAGTVATVVGVALILAPADRRVILSKLDGPIGRLRSVVSGTRGDLVPGRPQINP